MRRPVVVRSLVALLACGLGGCGTAANVASVSSTTSPASPPSLTRSLSASPAASLPAPSLPVGSLPAGSGAAAPTGSAAATFGEGYAVACGGHPTVNAVVTLLRNSHVLPRSAQVTVTVGPLCAGAWQYTVVSEAGHEPLQVVTQGDPASLVLVTAGTDVCTPMVRTQAPAGIVSVAHC
jgi:hypothetical protein